MQLYDFRRLINKYGIVVKLHQKSGHYVAGKWIEDDDLVREIRGAIVPISEQKIYQSGGTLTRDDREWFIPEALNGSLEDLTVTYKGNTYTVEQSRDFTEYANLAVYILKRVNTNA